MDESSQYTVILVIFSFILTILGFVYNISLANTTRPKYIIAITIDEEQFQYPVIKSHNFTINLSVNYTGNVDATHLYVLIGDTQSEINTSKTQISFSNFVKALSKSFNISSSESHLLEFNFIIDVEAKTLLIKCASQKVMINLKEASILKVVFIITSSESSSQELVSLDASKSNWVSFWWKPS